MKFGKLVPGDRFIFPCSLVDGEEKEGIFIYVKLEYPVSIFGVSSDGLSPRTAINLHSGDFFGVEDDTEILKIH